MVMRQDNAAGLVPQRCFDNKAGIYRRLVDGPFMNQRGIIQLVLGVQATDIKSFIILSDEKGSDELACFGRTVEHRLFALLQDHVLSGQLGDHG
jgi:hypothetical protein